jgi:DNA repair protein RecO (recombination protein O)
MTTRYKTRAFVFKKNDVNEADRVFSVFTSDFGRLDIFAKAIRKNNSKLRSGIDIFFMSDIEFIQGKNRKTLTDAVAVESFGSMHKSLEKFKVANAVGDILDNFIRGEEKDEKIFNLLSEVFAKLNFQGDNTKKYALVYYYFLWNSLSLLGYRPEVEKCNACQEKLDLYDIYFSNKLGGSICKKCLNQDSNSQKINSDIVKVLRLIFKRDLQIIPRLKIEPSSQKIFKEISNNYYSYIASSISFKNS